MDAAIKIRKATHADGKLIAEISRTTFYETFAGSNTKENMDVFMERQFAAEKLASEPVEPGNIFLLAYYNNELAGYAKLRDPLPAADGHSVDEIEIARIYSTRAMIGKGIGKALMLQCMEEGRLLGKTHIWLGVWEKNQRAIDFYLKFGFKKTGEHAFVLGRDIQTDCIMKRAL